MSTANGTAGGPPIGNNNNNNNNNFNPSMSIIIVVLIGACLVVAIFSMYIRKCTQGDEASRAASPSQSVHFFDRAGPGLDRTVIDELPIVSFSVVKTLKAGKEDLECAVCLERFEDEESLRLLPKCSHVFHTECIDEWFKSHSTCPLCRTLLKVTAEESQAGVLAVGEISRRILEAQEEFFGSSRRLTESVLDENEVLDGSSREVERDMERNSARMALFRNSDSFRQAARGVEVRERLASLSARYPAASSSSFSLDASQAPQRASSLNCVSLPRTNSLRDSKETETLFRYGSQRYGAAGSSSLTRLNEQVRKVPIEKEGASSSSNNWVTLEVDTACSPSAPKRASLGKAAVQDTRPMLLGKPRSGPLLGKQQPQGDGHRKVGSMNGRTERGFRSLRGSFSALHRSASEGRAQFFPVDPVPAEPSTTAGADGENNSGTGATFAQRTMQWLSGGDKHTTSSSARVSQEQRNTLQQIVTQ